MANQGQLQRCRCGTGQSQSVAPVGWQVPQQESQRRRSRQRPGLVALLGKVRNGFRLMPSDPFRHRPFPKQIFEGLSGRLGQGIPTGGFGCGDPGQRPCSLMFHEVREEPGGRTPALRASPGGMAHSAVHFESCCVGSRVKGCPPSFEIVRIPRPQPLHGMRQPLIDPFFRAQWQPGVLSTTEDRQMSCFMRQNSVHSAVPQPIRIQIDDVERTVRRIGTRLRTCVEVRRPHKRPQRFASPGKLLHRRRHQDRQTPVAVHIGDWAQPTFDDRQCDLRQPACNRLGCPPRNASVGILQIDIHPGSLLGRHQPGDNCFSLPFPWTTDCWLPDGKVELSLVDRERFAFQERAWVVIFKWSRADLRRRGETSRGRCDPPPLRQRLAGYATSIITPPAGSSVCPGIEGFPVQMDLRRPVSGTQRTNHHFVPELWDSLEQAFGHAPVHRNLQGLHCGDHRRGRRCVTGVSRPWHPSAGSGVRRTGEGPGLSQFAPRPQSLHQPYDSQHRQTQRGQSRLGSVHAREAHDRCPGKQTLGPWFAGPTVTVFRPQPVSKSIPLRICTLPQSPIFSCLLLHSQRVGLPVGCC